jgi:hypothetical protein
MELSPLRLGKAPDNAEMLKAFQEKYAFQLLNGYDPATGSLTSTLRQGAPA